MRVLVNSMQHLRIINSKMVHLNGIHLLLCIILTIGIFLPYSEACSCAIDHPQGYFCHSDFVVKAMVKSEKPIYSKPVEDGVKSYPIYQRYTLRIIRSFKENDALRNTTLHHLYTPASDSLCGQNFRLKQKYLISGSVSGGKLHTDMCQYNGLWDSLTKWQRRGLARYYGSNCGCQIEVCYSSNCRQKNIVEDRENMCIMDFNRDPDWCHTKYSRCSRRDNGDCQWNKTGDLKRCMAETKRKAWEEP